MAKHRLFRDRIGFASGAHGLSPTLRRVLADILTMVLFSTVIGMTIELAIAGLTIVQSVQARFMAVPVNMITGRPYGIYRDWLFSKTKIAPDQQVLRAIGDTVAFVSFQIPLYAMVLVISGATLSQVILAGASMSIVFLFSGRPYGMCLDWMRDLFAVDC